MNLQFESPKTKTSIIFALSILLAACGGGGGSDDPQTTKSDADKQPDKVEESRLVWEKLLPTTSFAYYSSPALSADEQTIYIGTAKNVRNDPAGSDVMVAYNQGLIILDHFSHVIFKNKEIKKDLIDLASVIK